MSLNDSAPAGIRVRPLGLPAAVGAASPLKRDATQRAWEWAAWDSLARSDAQGPLRTGLEALGYLLFLPVEVDAAGVEPVRVLHRPDLLADDVVVGL